MFESAKPPTGAAANWTEKLVMNFEPISSYKWDKPANRLGIQNLAAGISSLTNEYLEEPDKQKRENTLKETIELVEKMTHLLCGEPKKNIKALTDYGKNLKRLLNLYKGPGNAGYQDSTMNLIKQLEGATFLTPRINNDGSITIGYGYDFTEKGDPTMFNKYLTRDKSGNIIVKATMTEKEAEATIKLAADKKGITSALDNFISGSGSGNSTSPLSLNQNQYDALFSYFYANGGSVFTDSKYDEWLDYGGEHALRAQARVELRDYIITNNGNYDAKTIETLFVSSKGANLSYTYEERRRIEATLFGK